MSTANASTGGGQQNYSPLKELVVARVREFVRQPEAIFWSYFFPVLMVLALGLAFQNKPQQKIAVDVEAGPRADEIQQKLSTEKFEVQIHDEQTTRLRLRTGRTALVIQVQPGADEFHYVFDPSRPESALARLLVDDALQRAAGREDKISAEDRHVKEIGSRYVDFLVPGMLGMNIMAGGLWGVGFAIVYMRIRKLLKRLVATPMRRSHFLIAIMLSRLIFLIPGILIILGFAWVVFDVRIQGSVVDMVLFILAGSLTFSGIGLLVACRADTIETVSGLMNLVMLPMWVFSGVFFSSENFPRQMQPFIQALPLTPLIDGLRATMLEAQPLTGTAQLVRLSILLAWGIVTFGLALKWFRWN
jgi:ABC-2 type transport system permease protein